MHYYITVTKIVILSFSKLFLLIKLKCKAVKGILKNKQIKLMLRMEEEESSFFFFFFFENQKRRNQFN